MKLRRLRKRAQEKHGYPEVVSVRDRTRRAFVPFTGEVVMVRSVRFIITSWHRSAWRKK